MFDFKCVANMFRCIFKIKIKMNNLIRVLIDRDGYHM